MNRRNFLKKLGAGAAAVTAAALPSCRPRTEAADVPEEGPLTVADIPKDKMTYRTNPKTGEKVSLLGYGCMRWPQTTNDKGEEVLDQEAVNQLVDTALAHGVNYFDTSPAYCKGDSERVTGVALARHPRSSYFIATKLSNFDPSTWSHEKSVEMYHNSLRQLQTDYIDYMLLHAIGMGGMDALNGRYIDNGILDFLAAEREAGRIRNLGFSYHGDIKVFDHLLSLHDKYKWDFVQIQLNYVDWTHASEGNTNAEYLYGELQKRGIPAVIMEPLLGGRLSNVDDNIATRFKTREPQRSIASWAFRYAGTPEGVLTVLSGMTRMEHLLDNLRTYCPLKPLTDEEVQFLYQTADIMMQFPTIPCNDCKYCMPCPYGIDIPSIFIHYNKCVNSGSIINPPSIETAASDPSASVSTPKPSKAYAEARRAFLIGYDRSVPKLRQADHCIGCRTCNSHCPQNINIPAELTRINTYVESLKQNPA